MVVETGCRYFAELAFPDIVTAGLRVARIGTSSVRYEIGLFRNDSDEAAAEGFFVHVYVDRAEPPAEAAGRGFSPDPFDDRRRSAAILSLLRDRCCLPLRTKLGEKDRYGFFCRWRSDRTFGSRFSKLSMSPSVSSFPPATA